MTTRPIPTATASVLSPRERELARHALGLPNKNNRSYRNIFYQKTDTPCGREWMTLFERGLAVWKNGKPGWRWFALTRSGALAALEPEESLDEEDFPG